MQERTMFKRMVKKLIKIKRENEHQQEVFNEYTARYQLHTAGCIQQHERFIRLASILHKAILDICKSVLFNQTYGGLPRNRYLLRQHLETYKPYLERIRNDVFTESEWLCLYAQDKSPEPNDFTYNIYVILTLHCLSDCRQVENITEFKSVLEKLHTVYINLLTQELTGFTEQKFECMWNFVAEILIKHFHYNRSILEHVKKGYLDNEESVRYSVITAQLHVLEKACIEITNCAILNKLATGNFVNDNSYNEVCLVTEDVLKLKENINNLKTISHKWRNHNIEGEIIVINENLVRLKNELVAKCCYVDKMLRLKGLIE